MRVFIGSCCVRAFWPSPKINPLCSWPWNCMSSPHCTDVGVFWGDSGAPSFPLLSMMPCGTGELTLRLAEARWPSGVAQSSFCCSPSEVEALLSPTPPPEHLTAPSHPDFTFLPQADQGRVPIWTPPLLAPPLRHREVWGRPAAGAARLPGPQAAAGEEGRMGPWEALLSPPAAVLRFPLFPRSPSGSRSVSRSGSSHTKSSSSPPTAA